MEYVLRIETRMLGQGDKMKAADKAKSLLSMFHLFSLTSHDSLLYLNLLLLISHDKKSQLHCSALLNFEKRIVVATAF